MRRLSGAVCGLLWLAAACPALAAEALHIVAPADLRALLLRHLSVPPAGQTDVAAATDESASADAAEREAYARRLRKDAGALLATAGYFSPQFDVRYGADGPVLDVTPGVRATIGQVAIELRGALDEARRAQLRAGKGSDVLPGEHDLPGGGALQQRQTAQQRGFSRARHADDAVDVSFSDLQVHILQRRHTRTLTLKDLRQMRYRDQNRFSFSFPLCTALRRSKQKARPRNLRSKDGQKCSRYHLVSLFPHGKSLSRCARG